MSEAKKEVKKEFNQDCLICPYAGSFLKDVVWCDLYKQNYSLIEGDVKPCKKKYKE